MNDSERFDSSEQDFTKVFVKWIFLFVRQSFFRSNKPLSFFSSPIWGGTIEGYTENSNRITFGGPRGSGAMQMGESKTCNILTKS